MLLVATGGLAACGGRSIATAANPSPTAAAVAGPPVAREAVWELAHGGGELRDTVHRFAGSEGRTIVLRHPAPDNAVFAILAVPPRDGADSVTVRLSPVPSRYAVAIAGDPLPDGTTLTFSYGIHFEPPSGAKDRYPTSARLERALAIGRSESADRIQLLPSSRPAADVLRTSLVGPGTYVVAAPR